MYGAGMVKQRVNDKSSIIVSFTNYYILQKPKKKTDYLYEAFIPSTKFLHQKIR